MHSAAEHSTARLSTPQHGTARAYTECAYEVCKYCTCLRHVNLERSVCLFGRQADERKKRGGEGERGGPLPQISIIYSSIFRPFIPYEVDI